jgi:regulator of nonsense transcripts 2
LADELAVNFCYSQNKGARRRLVRALTAEMPVGALALLPYYSRIAATLAQVFPDIAQGELAPAGRSARLMQDWGRS